MATRLKTWRLDVELDAAVMAEAKRRGETVTDMLTRACQAYIRESDTGPVVYTLPAVEAPVYTPPEPKLPTPKRQRRKSAARPTPPRAIEYAAADLEPELDRGDCSHPADRVHEGTCRDCGAEFYA